MIAVEIDTYLELSIETPGGGLVTVRPMTVAGVAEVAPVFVGPQGPSAYQVALANGFVGTEAEWLASLEGPEGPPGIGTAEMLWNSTNW